MKTTYALLLLAACAPMTEDERVQFEYERAERLNEYIERRDACIQSGGIWYTNFAERKGRTPTRSEMRTAHCSFSVGNVL